MCICRQKFHRISQQNLSPASYRSNKSVEHTKNTYMYIWFMHTFSFMFLFWYRSKRYNIWSCHFFMPLSAEGRSGAYSVSLWCYVLTCVCHVRNQSLTNVTVHIQVYMQVYLHIFLHIYVQVAHNFDIFYATKLKFGIFTQTKTFMVELRLGGAGRGVRLYIRSYWTHAKWH